MGEKMKLKITEVSEPVAVGEKAIPKLTFKAIDSEGKENQYFTFRPTLFDAIKVDKEIEADVEVTTREWQGNDYTDRKVSQIYIAGQQVGGQKQGFGKSIETVKMELEAKAKNTALMQAGDLAKSDKIKVDEILSYADKFIGWLRGEQKVTTKEAVTPKEKLTPKEEPKKESVAEIFPPEQPGGNQPDYADWLADSLKKVHWKDVTVKSYLKNIFSVNIDGTVIEVTARLTQEQRGTFFKELQDRLDMA